MAVGRKRQPPRRPHLITRRDAVVCALGGLLVALGMNSTNHSPARISISTIKILDDMQFVRRGPDARSSSSAEEEERKSNDARAVERCKAQLRQCRKDDATDPEGRQEQRRRRRRLLDQVTKSNSRLKITMERLPPNVMAVGPVIPNAYVKPPDCSFRGPYSSMVPCYTTKALEREVQRHDRFVVDSLAYINGFDAYAIPAYARAAAASTATTDTDMSQRQNHKKPVTLIILTINRYVPYIATVLTSLLRGHDPQYLMDNCDIHVINIERRPCKCDYHLFTELRSRLPFVAFADWTEQYPQHGHIGTDGKARYIADQRLDYIRALEICARHGNDWCVVLEDDVILTANMIPKFLEATFTEDYKARATATSGAGGAGGGGDMGRKQMAAQSQEIRRDLALISLYYPLNDVFNSNKKELWRSSYADTDEYLLDINATEFSEARGVGTGGGNRRKPRIQYRLEYNNRNYGISSNAYPREILPKLINFLKEEPSDNTTFPTDVTIMHNFCKNDRWKLNRGKVSPSLVNHIGIYSEHRAKDDTTKISIGEESKRGGGVFFFLSTDVRFQLEEGLGYVWRFRRT